MPWRSYTTSLMNSRAELLPSDACLLGYGTLPSTELSFPTVVARRVEDTSASELGGRTLNYQFGGKVAEVLEVGYMPDNSGGNFGCTCVSSFSNIQR